MTRRKRTASPSSAQKRVAFEIPASLQHFSSISRSLATNAGSPQLSALTNTVSSTVSPSQTSLNNQTLTTPSPRVVDPSPSSKSATDERSAHKAQQWYRHPVGNTPPKPGLINPHSSAKTIAYTPTPSLATPSRPTQHLSQTSASINQIPHTTASHEPELKEGEAPSLTTHPNLIAALIAAKRAENEAKGNREKWARQQAEYQASKSPSTQFSNDSTFGTVRGSPAKVQSRATSSPLPARLSTKDPKARLSQTPQQRVVKPTATSAPQISSKDTTSLNIGKQNVNGPVFDSPFSSPIAEFLERATDDVGLAKEDLITPTTSGSNLNDKSRPSSSSKNDPKQSEPIAGIPPLFSDKLYSRQSQPNQSQSSDHSYLQIQQDSPASDMQQQTPVATPPYQRVSLPQTNTIPASSQNHQQMHHPNLNHPGKVQLQMREPQAQPYYPLPQAQQGFHKIDFRPRFMQSRTQQSPNNGSSQAPVNSFDSRVMANMPVPRNNQPVSRNAAQQPNNTLHPAHRMGQRPLMVPVPPSGPVLTYGNAMAKPAIVESIKPQQSPSGFMTAADMVAGINTRFKIATQNGFSVPKRY